MPPYKLTPKDLDAVVAVDAKSTGRRREEYFRIKLQQNLAETGIKVSLAAEADGLFRGFLLARVYYGEFGTLEQASGFGQGGAGGSDMRVDAVPPLVVLAINVGPAVVELAEAPTAAVLPTQNT